MYKIAINKNNKSQDKSDFTTSDEWKRLQQELFLYEKEGCHEINYRNPSTTTSSLDDASAASTITATATLANYSY